MAKNERTEKKVLIEKMAEKFSKADNFEGKSMAAMCISAYIEGRAAGKAEERRRWEQEKATA